MYCAIFEANLCLIARQDWAEKKKNNLLRFPNTNLL